MKKVGIILINYKEYANKYLSVCLASLKKQDYFNWQLFVVDNESSETSLAYLKNELPEATIIANANNDGFAKGNNDALKVMIQDGYDYAWVLNMDTEVNPDALSKLVDTLDKNPKIGAVQSRLMLYKDRSVINSLGNTTHFLGFGFCLGYQEKYQESNQDITKIFYPSGASVLFNLSTLKEVGLFDEEFWMYNEDQDLGWRIWLYGFECVINYKSIVYHNYEFSRSITKYYWMDRNRTLAILKNYSLTTLILVFPAWFIMELGLLVFSLQSGWFKRRLEVISYFFKTSTWKYISSERRKIQKHRKVRDKEILKMVSGKIWYQEIADPKLKIINPVFNLYFLFVKFLVSLFNV